MSNKGGKESDKQAMAQGGGAAGDHADPQANLNNLRRKWVMRKSSEAANAAKGDAGAEQSQMSEGGAEHSESMSEGSAEFSESMSEGSAEFSESMSEGSAEMGSEASSEGSAEMVSESSSESAPEAEASSDSDSDSEM